MEGGVSKEVPAAISEMVRAKMQAQKVRDTKPELLLA